jgi:hypothetical protein
MGFMIKWAAVIISDSGSRSGKLGAFAFLTFHYYVLLKRQIVIAVYFNKIPIVTGRNSYRRRVCLRMSISAAIAFGLRKMHIICNDFKGSAFVSLVVCVAPCLDRTFDGHKLPFAKISRRKFSRAAPAYDIYKIRLPFGTCFYVAAVDRKGKLCYRNIAVRVAQFWIGGKATV